MKVGDLVLENFEGVGLVMRGSYMHEYRHPTSGSIDRYDVVLVRFLQYGDTFEVCCEDLKVISESR